MELDFVVLADVAAPRPDGKIDIYGVGWDTIFAPSVPATHPRMDLVIRVLLSAQELTAPHRIVVTVTGPDGELGQSSADVPAFPPERRAELPAGQRAGVGVIVTFSAATYPRYGSYQLAITWDGTEVRPPIQLHIAPLPAAPTA